MLKSNTQWKKESSSTKYLFPFARKEQRWQKQEKTIEGGLYGLDVYAAGNADLNFVFDRYITTKTELRRTTYISACSMGSESLYGLHSQKSGICHWAPFFRALLGTGCRIGEAIGLRCEDIDFAKRTISINHSVTYYPRRNDTTKCEFGVSLPKTEAGIRTIPMMDAVYEAFQEEYSEQKEEGFNTTVVDGMTGFIFSNRFGNLHNPQAVNRAIKRIYESYNAEEVLNAKKEKRQPVIIPHFSCHHLRHTFCTRFCEKETNVKVIQVIILGKSPRRISEYSKLCGLQQIYIKFEILLVE